LTGVADIEFIESWLIISVCFYVLAKRTQCWRSMYALTGNPTSSFCVLSCLVFFCSSHV